MRLQGKHDLLQKNFIFYLTGGLIVLGIKYYYSLADCDSLLWILTPTTRWVEFLSGIPFIYQSGTGYVNHSLRLLIAPSCSGVQFMIITLATLVFSFVHLTAAPHGSCHPDKASHRILRGFGWIAFSIPFSWIFTIFVNGLRIITAMYLPMYLERIGLMSGLLTQDRLHTAIGVMVYVAALLTLYRMMSCLMVRKASSTTEREADSCCSQKADSGKFPARFARKCLPPLFWYFLITLGLPFLNRAYLKNPSQFAEYAALIVCCLALIMVPYCLLSLFLPRHPRHRQG